MGDAATPALPDFTSQTASVYKANIDAGFAVADRLAWAFAPHEQDIGSPQPDMTLRLEAGAIFDGGTLTEVAAQDTAVITAPSVNPRIDRVVIDRGTGTVSVVTGTEAASPSPPAITAGKVPVAQVALTTGTTEIVNSDITDERDLRFLGDPQPNVVTTRGDIVRGSSSGAPERLALGTTDQVLKSDGTDVLWGAAPGFAAGTTMLFHQSAAPTGWTKDVASTLNNSALRLVTSTAWASGKQGTDAFTTVFSSSKVTDGRSLSEAQLASHDHPAISGSFLVTAGSSIDTSGGAPSDGSASNTGTAGNGSTHDHTIVMDVNYINMIIATKD